MHGTRRLSINLHDKARPFMAWIAAVIGVTRAPVDKIDAARALRCHRASFLVEDTVLGRNEKIAGVSVSWPPLVRRLGFQRSAC